MTRKQAAEILWKLWAAYCSDVRLSKRTTEWEVGVCADARAGYGRYVMTLIPVPDKVETTKCKFDGCNFVISPGSILCQVHSKEWADWIEGHGQ